MPNDGVSSNDKVSRVERERGAYDGELRVQRANYARCLEHLRGCLSFRAMRKRQRNFFAGAEGKIILELGSSFWAEVLDLERVHPARCICINISQNELNCGLRKAEEKGVADRIDFRLMDAHHLELPDESVDLVYGAGILHHLNFEEAIAEIRRVLKPSGRCMFSEGLRLNPVAMLVRYLTPHARTPDECPLGLRELRIVRRYFRTRNHYYQLFAVPACIISKHVFRNPVNPLTVLADGLDAAINMCLPPLRPFFRIVLLSLEKMP